MQAEHNTPLRLIELGAGAGLPSILLILPERPRTRKRLSRPTANPHTPRECSAQRRQCELQRRPARLGHRPVCAATAADIVLAADTLWNSELHVALLRTTCAVLARTPAARAHFVAGMHTGRYTLESFFRAAGEAGLGLVEATGREVKGEGRQRKWDVRRAESEDECERRRWVVWSVLKWRD